ncbi:MAG TPA: rhodanese-like domain-containing protein [candidate division Zixibacteria bacterium]|nr:rhodanese-like domain-containing protein [candidate division Zixibacteria bacterium]
MKTINTDELRQRLDNGPLALFDVRGDVEYEKSHIPGAKTAPLGSLVFRVAHTMNPESIIVVYSNDYECTLASQAVERLENLGMKNVYAYQEGIKGWQAAGNQVIASPPGKEHTFGPVMDIRPVIVDRKTAYAGAFAGDPTEVEGAGG